MRKKLLTTIQLLALLIFTACGAAGGGADPTQTPGADDGGGDSGGGGSAPSMPVVVSMSPSNIANNNTPSVVGTADANVTVEIHTDSGCGSLVGSGPSDSGGNFSINVSVTDDTSTTYFALANNGEDSDCSSTSVTYIEDSTNPTDNTANVQFTNTTDNDGNDIAFTWTAFTDSNLSDHRIKTYTDSGCGVSETDHGLTSSTSNSDASITDSLTDGTYYAKVVAYDSAGNSTESACSTDSILVDATPPTDNTANFQFTNTFDTDGDDIDVSWTAFTDTNLTDHRLKTYTDSGCGAGETDHGLTSSTSNSNNTLIDSLSDGTYYAKVTAVDIAGNTTESACSSDSILIDSAAPVDNTANLQFTDAGDADGDNLAVTWTAFTDANLTDHRLKTYTDSGCGVGEVDHGLTGSSSNSDSVIIDGLSEGTYYAKVTAVDAVGFTTESACSSDSIIVDTTFPTDNTANLQFTDATDNDGNDLAVTWSAFSDTNLVDHRIKTYTDSGCGVGEVDHGLTGSSSNSDSSIIDGLSDGTYYAKVTAIDVAGNETESACSSDSILVDATDPTDNTANLQFTNAVDDDGDDLDVTWTAFTDTNLTDHRLKTYTDSGCGAGETDHGLIGSTSNSDNTIIDSLSDGTYYAKVTAIDIAGNETESACSTDSIIVDSTPPTDNTANLQFTDVADNDGNDVAVTWTAFTDTNLSDHRLKTYTNASCTLGEVDHGLTGSASNSDSAIIDGLTDGTYYAKVTAVDLAGHTTESACSTDTIIIDTIAPNDPTVTSSFPVSPASVLDPEIEGLGEADTDVEIFSDSGCLSSVGTGTVDGAGNFSITVTATVDVSVSYFAKLTDIAGNESNCSATYVDYIPYYIPTGMAWVGGTETVNSSNLNDTTAYEMKWDNTSFYDYDYFSHSKTTNAEEVTVKVAGDYLVSYTVPQYSTVQRSTVRARVLLNGSVVNGSYGESSYIRSSSGQNESSVHGAILLTGLSVNDVISVDVQRTANSGTVTVDSLATMMVEYKSGGSSMLKASATQTTNSTNFNDTTAYPLEWNNIQASSDFTITGGSSSNITFNTTSSYLVYFNLPLEGSLTRGNIKATFKVDGIAVDGGVASQGYIRNSSGHTNSSLQWSGLLYNISSGSVLTVEVEREGGSGTITVPASEYGSISIEKIETASNVFFGKATELVGGTNINSSSKDTFKWDTTPAVDTGEFTHSTSTDSHNITLVNGGDYHLIYNDALTASVSRANPKITVQLNGIDVTGAETKSHYLRNSGHNSASGSLTFLIKDAQAGDILTVSAEQEGASGTVTAETDTLLVLIKK